VTEPDVVGREEVIAVGQLGDQLAEHERARGETVQKDDRRAVAVPRFPVEELETFHGRSAVARCERWQCVLLMVARRSNEFGEWLFSAWPGTTENLHSLPPKSLQMSDEQARAAALDAADRLFYEPGIRAVRMEELRDQSGVSLKRLYKLFPNKDRLAEEALRRREAAFVAALRAYTETRRSPRARVLSLFDFLAEWFAEPEFRGCAFINAFGEMSSTSPCVLAAAQSQKRSLRTLVGELIKPAGGPAALADQVTMLFNGAIVSASMLGDEGAARHAKQAARALLDSQGL
jgi:AcrR family transcriptional regulator